MENAISLNATLCRQVAVVGCFCGTYCFCVQGGRMCQESKQNAFS
jgi:hypothetical protein